MTAPPRSESSTMGRLELPHLDGLRGIAALAVVLYHAYLFTGSQGAARAQLPWVGYVVGWGYLGVPVFIVLSGYVLMLPVLNTPELRLPRGAWDFVKRRGRRILPPYYGALLLSLALIALVPVMRTPAGTQWDTKIPVTPGGAISHLFMAQDLNSTWIGEINGPLWSVAVEWQIYFLMPLLLLPLWRRFPPAVIVVTLTAVLLATSRLGALAYLHLWLVGLFAAGMWAAQLTLRPNPPRRLGLLVGAGAAVTVLLMVGSMLTGKDIKAVLEVSVGLTAAAVLAATGRTVVAGRVSRVAALFSRRPLVRLGLFSYSLYLLHSPLIGLANLLLLPLGLPTGAQWAVLTFVVVPLDVAVCFAFFWALERHFLNSRQVHAKRELQSVDSPAVSS